MNNSEKVPYCAQEDLRIILFLKKNQAWSFVKGNKLWKIMEKKQVCPKRTYQSLRNRYLRNILPRLHKDYGEMIKDESMARILSSVKPSNTAIRQKLAVLKDSEDNRLRPSLVGVVKGSPRLESAKTCEQVHKDRSSSPAAADGWLARSSSPAAADGWLARSSSPAAADGWLAPHEGSPQRIMPDYQVITVQSNGSDDLPVLPERVASPLEKEFQGGILPEAAHQSAQQSVMPAVTRRKSLPLWKIRCASKAITKLRTTVKMYRKKYVNERRWLRRVINILKTSGTGDEALSQLRSAKPSDKPSLLRNMLRSLNGGKRQEVETLIKQYERCGTAKTVVPSVVS